MAESKAEDVSIVACALDADDKFVRKEWTAKALESYDVRIKVAACGVCHTDFFCKGRGGKVPGHEIVGEVVAVGDAVRNVKVGDCVGAGWQRDSCLDCKTCMRGEEQLCESKTNFMGAENGGYANYVTWNSHFVFKIPDGMDPKVAAPLMCAGATMYSALVNGGVRPGDRVGVVGIGGLGHIGLQFARAFGCEVVAFSRSDDKEAEAREFGANEFVNSKNEEAMKALKPLNFIVTTVAAAMDITPYLVALAPKGGLCLVGVPPKPYTLPMFPMLMKELRVIASLIGSRSAIQDMLEFAQFHGIKPKIQLQPLTPEGATKAFDLVDKNAARYRVVLVPEEE